jgi:hypothetical protein
MKTATPYLRQGVAAQILTHIILEPARKLYAAYGHSECGPFEGCVEDENSVFMTKAFV